MSTPEINTSNKETGNSNLLYSAIIENNPDCVKLLDKDGRIQFMNKNGQCLMEIEDFAAVKNQYWWDLWEAEEKEIVQASFHNAMAGKTGHFTAKCATAKGKFKWWDVVVSPVSTGQSGETQIVSISRDMTERKEQEKALQKMASHLQLATESANVGTWSLDMQTSQLEWSPLHKRMWGYDDKRDDLHYEDWHRLIHPEDKEKAFSKVEEAKQNHSLYEVEYRIERADDQSIRWIKSTGLYYYNQQGEAVTLTGVSIDITRQKQTEQELKSIKTQLEITFNNVSAAIQLRNKQGEIIYANEEAANILGFESVETMLIKKNTSAITEDVLSRYDMFDEQHKPLLLENAPYAISLKTGKTAEATILMVNKQDQSRKWVLSKSSALLDENKEVSLVIATNIDITAQKTVEEKIKESEERFRNLADQIPMWIWMADENVYVTYANQEILKYLGLKEHAQLTAHAWEAFVHPADIDVVYTSLGMANNKPVSFEFRVKNGSSGQYEWFRINAVPRNPENPSGFIGTAVNINTSKLAMQSLTESEARFRLLADIMPQQIWSSDNEGKLNYFNNAVYDYSGLTFDDIEKDGWMQIVHPNDREENVRKWIHAISTGDDFFMEHRFKNHAGEYRWQLSRAKPYRNADGKIVLWVGTSTDIHDQKIKEQQKDEFIGIASHEMKTPLTSAKGYLELLLMTLEKDTTPSIYAHKASKAVERLHNFVTELLDASKIQNGQINYNMSPFDFNELVAETVDNIQHSTRTHTIVFSGKVAGKVTGDRNRLMQVLVNLLTNAIKYSPEADQVIIHISENEQHIKVAVKDFGIGIGKNHLDKIFDRYYRVQEHAVYFQGLGIGLYISYNIVQRHGGTMMAESELGKGSTFYFTIPVQQEIAGQ